MMESWIWPALMPVAVMIGYVACALLTNKRHQALNALIQSQQQQIQQQTIQLAVAEERLSLLQGKEAELQTLHQQWLALKTENADLNARQQEQHKSNAEKIRLLQDAENQLKTQFENLAHKIFEERGKQFSEHNKLSIETLVAPLKEQLGEFKNRVESVYDNETKDRISLRE